MEVFLYIGLAIISFGLGFWFSWFRNYKQYEQMKTQLEKEIAKLEKDVIITRSELNFEKQSYQEKFKLIDVMKEGILEEFKNITNQKLLESSQRINQSTMSSLELVLRPFRETINKWEINLNEENKKQREEILNLKFLIEQVSTINSQISFEARNLTNALKGESKTRGTWGEWMMEKILESSGLIKGIHFEVQESFRTDEGNLLRPDIIIHLPANRDIVIDSKVSLISYERWINAETESIKEKALKDFLFDFEKQVKDLSQKSYQSIEALTQIDFVFLFVPIEGALSLYLENKPDSYQNLLKRNVLLVSPTTLILALRVTNFLWKTEKQNKNQKELTHIAGQVYDKIADFAKEFNSIGVAIDNAKKTFINSEKKLFSGSKSLIEKAKELKEFGADTTKELLLPKNGYDEEF
ncbi:MAG: DNA recombination protein RmuC [Leptospiraceae bacterium]|nr:DNA recombination protein RmuC [Leptospiraceae bacterium]